MARRPRGEGSVYVRKDGLYVAQYNGVYRYAKTEEQAKGKLAKLIDGDEKRKADNITVGALIDQYLRHVSATGALKPLTIRRYTEAATNHLRPSYGTLKASALDAATIEDTYTTKLASGLSASSIQVMHAVLSAAYKRGVRLGKVQSNPCRNVELPREPDDGTDEVEVFTSGEVHAILDAARGSYYEALWTLLLTTGARIGEITSIKGSAVNLKAGTLRITSTIHNGVSNGPKSKRGRRTIKLPAAALEVLRRHPNVDSDGYLFVARRNGGPLSYNTIKWEWPRLLERAGVKYRRMHTCRHTVATTALASPTCSITATARYLGMDTQTLLNTYEHLIPDSMDAVAGAMDSLLR